MDTICEWRAKLELDSACNVPNSPGLTLMSKIVLVCLRAPVRSQIDAIRHSLRAFLESLRPEGLNEAPVAIADDGRGLFLGLFNPVAATVHERSAYAGWLSQARE